MTNCQDLVTMNLSPLLVSHQVDTKIIKGRRVSTFAGRIRMALESAGIFDVPDLQARWRRAYNEELNRQTAHNWLKETAKSAEYEKLYRVCDLTKTSARWLALGDGPPTPAQQISPEQAEVLAIFAQLKGQRLDRWLELGRDLLQAQEAVKASEHVPFPRRKP